MNTLIAHDDFNAAVNQVREGLTTAGLKIVAEIPTSVILHQAGYEIAQTHQLMFFRPDLMKLVLTIDNSLIMSVPLKIVIREHVPGKIELIADDPEMIFRNRVCDQNWVSSLKTTIAGILNIGGHPQK